MSTLKPCPGCGSLNIEYMYEMDHTSYYRCMEVKCGWESPMGSEAEAIGLWNKRTDGEYDYQAGKVALETEILLLIDGYKLPILLVGLEAYDAVSLLCATIAVQQQQLDAIKDTPASEIPVSLHWLLSNIREEERTIIHERIKDNLYDLVYNNNNSENKNS